MQHDETKKLFSKNLKQLLTKNNLKNIDLANELGLSKAAISNYLSGETPRMKTVAEIANLFDVSVDYLLGRDIDIKLNESGSCVYTIPLFHKTLINTEIIYRNDNYIGEITLPFPVYEDFECYALTVHNDSMVSYGITKGCLVVFGATLEAENGDIAAVLIKSKNTIIISSVNVDSKCITLTNSNGSESYKKTKTGCDAIILGKVIYATFNPNNQK